MLRPVVGILLILVFASHVFAEESAVPTRPITEAEAVLAVYYENWGLASSEGPAIIIAVWPDGHIVWSDDSKRGGAPYHAGQIDPQKFARLLKHFGTDGLFADKDLNNPHFGPDSAFLTVFVKSEKKKVKMQSWHELVDSIDDSTSTAVVDSKGISLLQNKPRLAVLRNEPADYLFFRFVWSETRGEIASLIPCDGKPSTGKPVMKAGILSWQD